MGQRSSFPEIPELAHTSEPWRVIVAKKWRRKEHMMPLECEAGFWSARLLSRLAGAHSRRQLMLSGSMGWVCAASKGRSFIWSVLRRCLELCAPSIASDASLIVRWILSEVNPADETSRRFDKTSTHYGARHGQPGSLEPRRSTTTSWHVTCCGCSTKELFATTLAKFCVQRGGLHNSRPMSKRLPLTSASLAGWRRLEPSTCKPPLPRIFILIVSNLIAKNQT